MKKIPKYTLIVFFLILLYGVSSQTIHSCYSELFSIVKQGAADSKNSYVSALEDTMDGHLWKKSGFIEFSGLARKLLNLHLTDDRQFYKDRDEIVHLAQRRESYDPLINSAGYLADILNEREIPFLVCQIAERGMYGDGYSELFDKTTTEYIQPLKAAVEAEGAIYLDYASALQELGFEKEDIFFKTDIHYQTQAEFAVLGKVIDALEKNSKIIFPNKDLVMDLSNYRTEAYPFLGNLGASTGTIYTGEDTFLYYLPEYETSMRLENPSQSLVKEGIFEQVCLNEYRSIPCTNRTYRVIDYMQWSSPYYIIKNDMLKKNDILLIGDSLCMRTAAYLTLLCHSVTVLDPRFFNDLDYLQKTLEQDYDAVILFASETLCLGIGKYYDAEILSIHELLEEDGTFSLEVTADNTGTMNWSEQDDIFLTLWTGDLDMGIRGSIEPGVVVRPGEQCKLKLCHMDKGIVARALRIQMLKESHFYFGEAKEIDLRNKIQYTLNAEILSVAAPASVNTTDKYAFDVTVKNTGTSAWSEQDQIRLTIWQDGYDHGYRLPLPSTKTVCPGETYTFPMENFVAPQDAAPGDATELMFWMAQEGITYFGEQKRAVIRVE